MEYFIKYRAVASLESCQRSVMEVFYEIDDFFSCPLLSQERFGIHTL